MKGLNLITVVFGLTCLSIYAYPVWNEQKNCLEDTASYFDYNAIKDKDLFAKLIRGESNSLKGENKLPNVLRDLARNLDDATMNFLGSVQSINHLSDEVPVDGTLKETLGHDKISAPTAIYIYQIMFSEEGESFEAIGNSFDEYVKGMMSDPFSNENKVF